jgi:hypothetical protein
MKKIHVIIGTLLLSSVTIFAQIKKDKNKLTGTISDAVNGIKIDSVKVSFLGNSVFSDANGSFILQIPKNKAGKSKEYVLTFSKNNFDTLTVKVPFNEVENITVKIKSPYPLRNIFHLFDNPNIPDQGPKESIQTAKCAEDKIETDLIGGQLNRHNFIYIGENNRRICLVLNGKLAWHYDTEDTWEDDDIWLLSNGNVLHAHMKYIEEITPMKEIVWRYDNPVGTEIHTCQPIGIDKVLFLQNQGNASVVRLYNKVTRKFEFEKELKELNGGPHGQARRFRLNADGTYLAAAMSNNKIFEYDKDFNLIRTINTGPMWSGVKLKNGNYLVQNEKEAKSIEFDKDGKIVWQVTIEELQSQIDKLAPGLGKITSPQTCERLANGNTVIFTRFCDANIPQAIEVTPDKKIVWILKDWKNLGDSVSAQFLNEPGYPEVPGDTNH